MTLLQLLGFFLQLLGKDVLVGTICASHATHVLVIAPPPATVILAERNGEYWIARDPDPWAAHVSQLVVGGECPIQRAHRWPPVSKLQPYVKDDP